jgi:hypothetical protein
LEVGFTRLLAPPGGASKFLKLPVVVEGLPDPTFRAPSPIHRTACPIAQMRSDWVESKHGFRVRHAATRSFRAFRALRVRPFDGLLVSRSGESIEVRLTNTFAFALRDVSVLVHYEGCYGKPGSTERRSAIATLAAGQTHAELFPTLDAAATNTPSRQWHRVSSVQVTVGEGQAIFDLDWSLDDAGVQVRCPDKSP